MLTEKEKLDEFSRSIRRELSAQLRQIDQEVSSYKHAETERIENEVYQDCYRLIQTESEMIRLSFTTRRSKAVAEIRRSMLLKRDEFVSKIFDQVLDRLRAFTTSPEYEAFLRRKLLAAAGEITFQKPMLQVTEQDLQKQALFLEVFPSATITASPQIGIGGFVLYDEGKAFVINESLENTLEEQKSWFYANSGLRITQLL